MAVVSFLELLALVVGVWAPIAYARAGAQAADTGIDGASAPGGYFSFADGTGAADNEGATTSAVPPDTQPKGVTDPPAALS